jgi:predicted AlkP superfamily pyrophosphatase or phosphodiesterase
MIQKLFFCSLTMMAAVSAGSCLPQEPPSQPKLLLVITLDQFRSDYLDRYHEAFEGGIRRALDQGRRWPRALVDHAPTLSYPGHATLATGALPRNHGFTSNSWLQIDPDGNPSRDPVPRLRRLCPAKWRGAHTPE